ncbi:putative Tup1, general repressor of transcription [Cryphonectria parasitica EP155]|uniref:Tup1, general repressor of transcription n=1 Tax=Cryphonectria parasitica (strain ATCC 38755 / EP155) TaxID=660469 RepID=A0A9P5CNL1_CRYP1|nr:putative Tup1, general repressor of transcription [Cryphonectria parasitica EP155]KAF3765258.1 putative Tup1, general repressor of transcription [Cryphonectria parasitica EP155]
MSYRYPHQDDSDENGYGESLQQASGSQPHIRNDSNDDSDDDDLFEPAAEESEALNFETTEDDDEDNDDDDEDEDDPDYEGDDDEFHDAEQGYSVEVVIGQVGGNEEEDDDDDDEGEEETARTTTISLGTLGRLFGGNVLSRPQLLALLQGRDLGQIFGEDDNEDHYWARRRRRNPPDPNRFPKVPSEEGRKLMDSGAFGSTDRLDPPKKRLARRVLDRELGIGWGRTAQSAMAQQMIPSSEADLLIHYHAPVYCGQFSQDGNFFYACVKDFKVRMYDTSNPYNWRYYKTASFNWGQWTLTDAHLSPDNRWLAYTSLQSHVAFAPTDPNDKGDPYQLDLAGGGVVDATNGRPAPTWARRNRDNFAIWSIRFSGDGRELIAGNNVASIVVYDIESRRVLHNIVGHEDDVNAVAFANPKDPHIIYSGSDDQVIKVWDRRSMADGRAAGAFVGHCEGLTYIDSKGDGRYILSNSKDQTMKLWDLRMAMSTEQYARLNPRRHTMHTTYDYRMEEYDQDDWFPHPDDNSVVTFRGHKVQGTLIRCHFSPPGSTDSRYVYSGSHDGKVYVWNMDATLEKTIDVGMSTHWNGRVPGGGRAWRSRPTNHWNCCVREPSWHPNAPIMAASSWGGYDMSFGSVSVHSWNENSEDDADPPMRHRVNDQLAAEWLADS